MSERLPVTEATFWRRRILETIAQGWEIHHTVYRVDISVWQEIQERTRAILMRHLQPGQRLLDAGCGYGATVDCLPEGVEYLGVDLSNDLLEMGRVRHQERKFECWDLRSLPNHYPPGHFDFALCRSLRGMVRQNVSHSLWDALQKAVLTVSRVLIVIEYEDTEGYDLLTGGGGLLRMGLPELPPAVEPIFNSGRSEETT